MEQASIRFYEVRSCGLYRGSSRTATLGSFSAIAENIFNWSRQDGRLIQNTCTYEVEEDSEFDFLETYLASARKSTLTGDYLFTFWNRTHASGESSVALDLGATINDVTENQLHRSTHPDSSIPGFATYFWLIPSRGVMATITFGSPRTGMNAFNYWLENFFRTESRYAMFENDNFTGYANGENQLHTDLEPRFTKRLYKNPAKRDIIINNRTNIRGVTRRIKLDRANEVHNDALEGIKSLLGLTVNTEFVDHEIPLTFELNQTPSEEELSSIMDDYENENSPRSSWEDVGFMFPRDNSYGANEKEWLSKSYAKTKISLIVEWVVTGQLINGADLLQQLDNGRQEYLSLITEPVAIADEERIDAA